MEGDLAPERLTSSNSVAERISKLAVASEHHTCEYGRCGISLPKSRRPRSAGMNLFLGPAMFVAVNTSFAYVVQESKAFSPSSFLSAFFKKSVTRPPSFHSTSLSRFSSPWQTESQSVSSSSALPTDEGQKNDYDREETIASETFGAPHGDTENVDVRDNHVRETESLNPEVKQNRRQPSRRISSRETGAKTRHNRDFEPKGDGNQQGRTESLATFGLASGGTTHSISNQHSLESSSTPAAASVMEERNKEGTASGRSETNATKSETDRLLRPSWLFQTTKRLLEDTAVGKFTNSMIRDAYKVMDAWAKRRSRASALMVEKMVKRLVEESLSNPNVTRTGIMYTMAIDGWAKSGETGSATRAEEILDMMQLIYEDGDENLKPNDRSFNAVLSAWARSGRPDAPKQIERVMTKMMELRLSKRNDIEPNTISVNCLLLAHARCGTVEAVRTIRSLLMEIETKSTTARDGSDDDVRQLWPSTLHADTTSYQLYMNSILYAFNEGALSDAEVTRLVEDAIEWYQSKANDPTLPNVQPALSLYTVAITTLSRCSLPRSAEKALTLLQRAEQMGLKPEVVAYKSCVAAFANQRRGRDNARTAETILRRMEELAKEGSEVKPDVSTYNAVLRAYSNEGGRDSALRAEKLLLQMQALDEKGNRLVQPSLVSFNAVCYCWARSGDENAPKRIEQMIENMESNYKAGRTTNRPNTRSYNAVLNCYIYSVVGQRGAEQAEIFLNRMEELHLTEGRPSRPDFVSFTTVITAWARPVGRSENDVKRMLHILSRMEELYDSGYSENIGSTSATYNCVLSGISKCAARNKPRFAKTVLDRMKGRGLLPNTLTFNNVVNSCAYNRKNQVDDPDEVIQIALDSMREGRATCGVSHRLYADLFRTIANLMPRARRGRIVNEAVQNCMEDGLFGAMVLHFMVRACADDIQRDAFLYVLLEDAVGDQGEDSQIWNDHDRPMPWADRTVRIKPQYCRRVPPKLGRRVGKFK